MGQTYGQMTGQLLRGAPGIAWPPAHRTLLPPIRPPRSPEVPRGSLPDRWGHQRLSSSMIPGYTGTYTDTDSCPVPACVSQTLKSSSLPPAHPGFIPKAQFIFAKNCNRVWAEALNELTQRHGERGSPELSKQARGEDVEEDREPEPKPEPELGAQGAELGQEAGQVRLRRLRGVGDRWGAVWWGWGAVPLCRLGTWACRPAPLPGSLCQSTGATCESAVSLPSTSLPGFPLFDGRRRPSQVLHVR